MKPIVVEGMDHTGKSTLIYPLADKLSAWVAKNHDKKMNHGQIQSWHTFLTYSPHLIIADRHPVISDYVYGNVIRGFSPASLQMAEFYRPDMYLVYCRPPTAVVMNTLAGKKHMEGVLDHAAELLLKYDELMNRLQPDFIFDYTENTLEELYERVKDL